MCFDSRDDLQPMREHGKHGMGKLFSSLSMQIMTLSSLLSTCSWCVVSALAPLSCGSRRIIQVDAAHWWWLRRDPPHMTVKRFGCTTIHKKRYINASFIHSSLYSSGLQVFCGLPFVTGINPFSCENPPRVSPLILHYFSYQFWRGWL